MDLRDAQKQIHKLPENAPEWLKQCYKAIKNAKCKPQNEALATVKKILENQNRAEVIQNINALNKFNTNLLWLASIYGKNKLVNYLTQQWGANSENLFKFEFVCDDYKLNIIEITGLFAAFADQAKQKGWINKDTDPKICFDYLNTTITLTEKMGIHLNKIKFTTLAKHHLPYTGSMVIEPPKWLKDQLNELKEKEKAKKIKRTNFFDVTITLKRYYEENSTGQLYHKTSCTI